MIFFLFSITFANIRFFRASLALVKQLKNIYMYWRQTEEEERCRKSIIDDTSSQNEKEIQIWDYP